MVKLNKHTEPQMNNPLGIYIKGILAAYFFAFIIFLIMALLITYTNISESIIPMLTFIVVIISSLTGGMYVAVKLRKKGWVHGILIGLTYMVTILLLSWMFINDFTFDKQTLLKTLSGVLAGGLGGIIGVNMK